MVGHHETPQRESPWSTVGKALMLMLLLCIPLLAMGAWYGWFDFSRDATTGERRIVVDRDRVKRDIDRVADATDEFSVAAYKEAEGRLVSVDQQGGEVTLETELDDRLTLKIGESSRLMRDHGPIEQGDLESGQHVRVQYSENDANGPGNLRKLEVLD